MSDLCLLGEVCRDDLADQIHGHRFLWCGDGHARLGDIGCYYSTRVIAGSPTVHALSVANDGAALDARIVQLRVRLVDTLVVIFAVHSHSRIGDARGIRRREVATILRAAIDISRNDTDHVLVLGDFNDEPFDQSVSEMLRTSRDAALVLQRRNLLYNPSWRFMHDSRADENLRSFVGTAHKRELDTHWRAFDQVLMSGGWLQPTSALQFAGLCEVILPAALLGEDQRTLRGFDHLPIAAKFTIELTRRPPQ